ncbi:MAG: molybdopterin molybdenumtransferase MoeA [Chromatiales bacterium]|jgi:molybdopterin molybdotransferase|nr:molybdopterin molybdenumtransferase MoeA [Chromatiales bacterium]
MKNQTDNFRIDVDTAVRLIADHMPTYPSESVSLESARGAILRQQVVAERDQPPFDRVTMDGIAIRSSALAAGTRSFHVKGTQGAGVAAIPLEDDSNCIEIMTGALLPDDADTIVPVERIERNGDDVTLESGYEPNPGQFIHRRGSDLKTGQPLLEPGTLINAPAMAALTIAGTAMVSVARWPKIVAVSTGDELIDVGNPIELFQIRSSNDRVIAAALEQRGCTTAERACLPDDLDALRRSISTMHEHNDILILSGGVSMGKYDYVPQIMDELGVRLVFHKILQRPGLPMWFGVSAQNKPVFALPGNPVSSLVCLIRYVLPAIRASLGATLPEQQTVRLAETIHFESNLTCFMPVKLGINSDGDLRASPKPTNTSGDFVSLARTDGFVELSREQNNFTAGEPVSFYQW